jgi:F420-non-reducing hydrogenase small subunit
MAKRRKIKVGFYWAATCGGCDVAILDIADIVLWPVAMDFKTKT